MLLFVHVRSLQGYKSRAVCNIYVLMGHTDTATIAKTFKIKGEFNQKYIDDGIQ